MSIFENSDITQLPSELQNLVAKWTNLENRYVLEKLEKGSKSSIFLYGSTATGKTHTAHAIKKELQKKLGGQWAARMYNYTEMMYNLKRFKEREDDEVPMDVAMFKTVLIIDDLGAKAPSENDINALYIILNKRYELGMPTLITSNLSVAEIGEVFGDRIASRIDRMAVSFKFE